MRTIARITIKAVDDESATITIGVKIDGNTDDIIRSLIAAMEENKEFAGIILAATKVFLEEEMIKDTLETKN
jgi:hypothetical protein